MRIGVFGLGYVGCVSAACFACDGHRVIGVDIHPYKVDTVNSGRSPIIEPGLEELIQSGQMLGRLSATSDARTTVHQTDLSLICVGTPSNANGSLRLEYVERVCREIACALAEKDSYHVVVVRSTVLPGTVERRVIPILEEYSGKVAGADFGVCTNPEFMREGSAVEDFYNPPFTLIGQLDERSGNAVEALYAKIEAPLFRTPLKTAEMVKYASNAFHALKVVFANEIGNLCKVNGIDSHEVMDIFCTDDKLNLSKYYLRPGFAFGGSCLGKDLRALLHQGRRQDLILPVLNAVLPSNVNQIERASQLILESGSRHIGVIGLSFKPGTDDLRESPIVEVVERLIGKGCHVAIYDREVALSRVFGSNKEFIDRVLPHIGPLVRSSLEAVVHDSEVIVVAKPLSQEDHTRLLDLLTDGHVVIDLVRIDERQQPVSRGEYHGICW